MEKLKQNGCFLIALSQNDTAKVLRWYSDDKRYV
ncbi:hypothetical protein predicted by Glimmer/Critica [Bdellovibrio bacteriovorus HD100]|uniref:Uncharacterized protein n=1 Tax=Bdellovibrio bacteriovorus (strain ATCC 15356 / DSM 50701 / NCIMB 9529 / HD100) TaxID=264462 RepID=Q6MQI6_BDEBA|nr:hypothetical protein predicted by Glimmer/Critica [Bdellovibrio bacteriovorus HD100]